MYQENNIMMMENQNMKENIYMEKDMEKEKNIMMMVVLFMKENL